MNTKQIKKYSDLELELKISTLNSELEQRSYLKNIKEVFKELVKFNTEIELYDDKEDENTSTQLLFKYKDKVHIIDLRELHTDLEKYKKVSN